MASVLKQIDVDANVDMAWLKVADAGSVDKLISQIKTCRLEGDMRYCAMADGAQIVEQIVTIDNDNRRMAYRISGGDIPFEFHAGSMQVVQRGTGARLLWAFDFKPDALEGPIAQMLEAAAESIRLALA